MTAEAGCSDDETESCFDQLADEAEFYKACVVGSSSSDVSLVDSGYNTARSYDVPLRAENQLRGSSRTKKKAVFEKKLAEYRSTQFNQEKGRINTRPQGISWHLLDFIEPRRITEHESPRKRRHMFEIADEVVHLCPAYQVEPGRQNPVQMGHIEIAQVFLQTHTELADLETFAEQQRRVGNVPLFMTAWLEFYTEYILFYRKELKRLQNSCPNPLSVLWKTQPLREQVTFLHSIVEPVKSALMWKYAEMELFFSLVVGAVEQESLSDAQKELALGLQKKFYSVLLDTMDHLYHTGHVLSSMKDHFVIYAEDGRSHEVRSRKQISVSPIWSSAQIEMVHRSLVMRNMLPVSFFTSPTWFSDEFNGILPDWKESIFSLGQFRLAVETVTKRLAVVLGEEMFRRAIDAGFQQLLSDMKNICVGLVATNFASSVFNLGDKNMLGTQRDTFHVALHTGKVSSVARWRRIAVPGYTGELCCEVDGVLSKLASKTLFSSLNLGLDCWMKLYRMHFLMVDIASEGKPPQVPLPIWRSFKLTTNLLHHIVEIIRAHFLSLFNEIFDSAMERFDSAATFYDLEALLVDLEKRILKLVDSNDLTAKMLWANIDRLSILIDDIRLKSLSGFSSEAVSEWYHLTMLSLESLRSQGSAVVPGDVFYSLCKQIQHS